MLTTVCVHRWSYLLILAIMILSASTVRSQGHFNQLSCCLKANNLKVIEPIKECYFQNRGNCPIQAYRIITFSGKHRCIKPTPLWLKKLLKKGLDCPSDVGITRHRFEVLANDHAA